MTTSIKGPESSLELTPLLPPTRTEATKPKSVKSKNFSFKTRQNKSISIKRSLSVEPYGGSHLGVVKTHLSVVKAPDVKKNYTLREKLGVGAGVLALVAFFAYNASTDRSLNEKQMAEMMQVKAPMTETGPEGLLRVIQPGILDGKHQNQVGSINDSLFEQEKANLPSHEVMVPVLGQYEEQAIKAAEKNDWEIVNPNS